MRLFLRTCYDVKVSSCKVLELSSYVHIYLFDSLLEIFSSYTREIILASVAKVDLRVPNLSVLMLLENGTSVTLSRMCK